MCLFNSRLHFYFNLLIICTDHDSYAQIFNDGMNQRNIFINLGIDRFHYLLMQILRTTSYQDYFIQLHMAASIIFCIGVYNLRKKL